MLNFPSPDSDYALLPLLSVIALTGLPLWIGLLVKIIKSLIIVMFCKNTTNGQDLEKKQVEGKKLMEPAKPINEIDFKLSFSKKVQATIKTYQ